MQMDDNEWTKALLEQRKLALVTALTYASENDVGTVDGFMCVVGRFDHYITTGETVIPK